MLAPQRRENLWALGQRTDQLMLTAVADLTSRFTAAHIDNSAQRLAEIVLAVVHSEIPFKSVQRFFVTTV